MPGLPVANVRPVEATLDRELQPWRLGAAMFGVFGAIALVLTTLGLYSLIAYSVVQRTHELGVRAALGAQPRDIASMVLLDGVKLAAAGVALGAMISLGLGRFVDRLLYDVSPRDPAVFASAIALLLLVAGLASLLPALVATKASPLDALRGE